MLRLNNPRPVGPYLPANPGATLPHALPQHDPKRYSRLGWTIVLIGVLGFSVWGAFAPLDQGVPVHGSVIVSGNRKAVQHQSGGTVAEILVKDGDSVTAGQVLVRMNPTQAAAQAEIARTNYLSALAVDARLRAELVNATTITFPPELLEGKEDPRVQTNMTLQQQLFQSRRDALRAELGAYQENIAGNEAQMVGVKDSLETKRQQLVYTQEELIGLRELTKEGYLPRNRLLERERLLAQLNGSIAEDVGTIGRLQRQVGEMRLRRLQRIQEFQKEVRTQLTEVQRDVRAGYERVAALTFDLQNAEVKSPADGVVVGLAVHTNGGVVSPGFLMMDIVPKNEPLIVEGRLPINLVDKVAPGLPVEMRFSAFNANTTPIIDGHLKVVAADSMTDPKTGEPYYPVTAQADPKAMASITHMQVKPGMPVELFIKTGERTFFSYLFKPLVDRSRNAMREE